jgi:hypothetical protein
MALSFDVWWVTSGFQALLRVKHLLIFITMPAFT